MLGFNTSNLSPLLGVGYSLQSMASALSGNPAYQQSGQQQLLFGMQMAEQAQKRKMLEQIIPTLPPQLQQLAQYNPDAVLNAYMEQQIKPTVVQKGAVLMDSAGNIVGQNPDTPEAKVSTKWQEYLDRAAGNQAKARQLWEGDVNFERSKQGGEKETWRTLTPDETASRGFPAGGVFRQNQYGKVESVVAPRNESSPGHVKVQTIKSEAGALKESLGQFRDVVNTASFDDFMSANSGGATAGGRKLNTAYNNAALLAKSEALFNLGVLNGPDLDIIRRTLPDPSTFSGMVASKDAYKTAIDEVVGLIDSRVAQYDKNFNGIDGEQQQSKTGGFDFEYVPGRGLVPVQR